MPVITLEVQEWDRIVQLGTIQRLRQLKAELEEIEKTIADFERRYGMTLAELRVKGLPDDADRQAHEDFADWVACENRRKELMERISKL
ncbi:MAG TPA: hypothetical protein ENG33_01800 [Chloroflexi bacterium]|nr:hypothetical protein [Chloroflexota bacterium]